MQRPLRLQRDPGRARWFLRVHVEAPYLAVEVRFLVWVWQLRGDEGVQRRERWLPVELHHDVGVWEASLLELNDADLIHQAPELLTQEGLQDPQSRAEGAADVSWDVRNILAR